MRLKIIVSIVIIVFFIGCGDDKNESKNAPQPNVTDELVQPPKVPSI